MKMVEMKVLAKHDSKTFYPGERRMLEDDEAAYFCKHGWATADGLETGTSDTTPVALAVQPGSHPSKTKVG